MRKMGTVPGFLETVSAQRKNRITIMSHNPHLTKKNLQR